MRLFLSIAIIVLPLVTFGQIPFSLQDRAFLQSTSPLRKDLAGYWRLEEASGTRYDFSKNGNHLTSNNSVGQAAGVSGYTGNAATFANGSSQFLSIPSNSTLQASTNGWYISSWVKLTTKTNDSFIVAKYDDSSAKREYILYFCLGCGGSGRFTFLWSTNGTAVAIREATSFGIPATNTWYFVEGGWDKTNAFVSVNMVSNKTALANPIFQSTSNFQIGKRDNATDYMNGTVDEVVALARFPTTDERVQLFNAGLGTHFPWAHP